MKKRGKYSRNLDEKRKIQRKYFLRKYILALLFLAVLYGYTAVNAVHAYQVWFKEWVGEFLENVDQEIAEKTVSAVAAEMVQDLDSHLVDEMYEKMDFIEIYSYVQTLLDKREFNNFSYIKDEDGYLHYASFFREDTDDVAAYARRVKRLKDEAEKSGADVIFCVTPGKYMRGTTRFRTGMPVNDPNQLVDELLFYLNRYGVETLDYRLYFPNEQMTIQDAFFRTDHHWTVPAAFEATRILVQTMEERFGANLDPQGYLAPGNYERVTYRHGMMGSMGRRTGANFCELEDFEALWPVYQIQCTRDTIDTHGRASHLEGELKETLMDPEVLFKEDDIYSNAQYALYLNTISPYERIVNLDNPDGPRVLAVRDSYFSPTLVFMTPMCSEIEAVWVLEETQEVDIEELVRENQYDYIVMELYPYNINDDAFNYFKGR